jgi:hypothetical protein
VREFGMEMTDIPSESSVLILAQFGGLPFRRTENGS